MTNVTVTVSGPASLPWYIHVDQDEENWVKLTAAGLEDLHAHRRLLQRDLEKAARRLRDMEAFIHGEVGTYMEGHPGVTVAKALEALGRPPLPEPNLDQADD